MAQKVANLSANFRCITYKGSEWIRGTDLLISLLDYRKELLENGFSVLEVDVIIRLIRRMCD